ncbi:hypothetical protein FOCC_FOCC014107 [Frankliniella occidentalis]|nr:hypothetical protein FOCC_FOCC014107 [Frankliniella occidentalis]
MDIRAVCEAGRASTLTLEELDKLLLEVIIESKLPFQILGRPKFTKLMKRLAPGRSTARRRVPALYNTTKDKLIAELARVTWMGTTADAWKSRGKQPDILATLLSDIFQKYGIQEKISCTVTDNESNFLKAVRQFRAGGEDSDDDLDMDSTKTERTEDDDDEPQVDSFGDIFVEGEGSGAPVSLPPHRRRACHLLNLVATTHLEKALERPGLVNTAWGNVLSKCKAFWSKQRRSTVA